MGFDMTLENFLMFKMFEIWLKGKTGQNLSSSYSPTVSGNHHLILAKNR